MYAFQSIVHIDNQFSHRSLNLIDMHAYIHVYLFSSMWGTGLHFLVQIRCAITSCSSHQVPLAFSQLQVEVHLYQQLQQPKERAPLGFGLCKWVCPWAQHSRASSHGRGCSKVLWDVLLWRCGVLHWSNEGVSFPAVFWQSRLYSLKKCFSSLQKRYLWEGCSSDTWSKLTLPTGNPRDKCWLCMYIHVCITSSLLNFNRAHT